MNEHELARTGLSGRLLLVGFAMALCVLALFCLTFTVDLRCERVAARELFCSSHSHSLLHDTVETIEASAVEVPIRNGALLLPQTKRAIAGELDVYAQGEDDTPFVKHIAGEPFPLGMIAVLMLFLPAALWGALRSTVVTVDRRAGTVTISRRLLGFSTSRKILALSQAVTVIGKQNRRGQDLFLQLRRGEPVHIAWVSQRHAVTDFAALKRLFPV